MLCSIRLEFIINCRMKETDLDLYTDYLISPFGPATVMERPAMG